MFLSVKCYVKHSYPFDQSAVLASSHCKTRHLAMQDAMSSNEVSCNVIYTIDALLLWLVGQCKACTLAFVYLDNCDVFNDSDMCDMCCEYDAVVIMVYSLSDALSCQDLIKSVQSSNLVQLFNQQGNPCALFTPTNESFSLALGHDINFALCHRVFSNNLPYTKQRRYALLLQLYVRMAFLLRPRMIFIDHRKKSEIWCMQYALSSLGIHTGVSKQLYNKYIRYTKKRAKNLTSGQVFGTKTNRHTAYQFYFFDKIKIPVISVNGIYIFGYDDKTAPLRNREVTLTQRVQNYGTIKFLKSYVTFSLKFVLDLSLLDIWLRKLGKHPPQSQFDYIFWFYPNLTVSVAQEKTFYTESLYYFYQTLGYCNQYCININSVLSVNFYDLFSPREPCLPIQSITPAKVTSPTQLNWLTDQLKSTFAKW